MSKSSEHATHGEKSSSLCVSGAVSFFQSSEKFMGGFETALGITGPLGVEFLKRNLQNYWWNVDPWR